MIVARILLGIILACFPLSEAVSVMKRTWKGDSCEGSHQDDSPWQLDVCEQAGHADESWEAVVISATLYIYNFEGKSCAGSPVNPDTHKLGSCFPSYFNQSSMWLMAGDFHNESVLV